MGAAAINAIVSPWFVRTRPAALAMAYNGASIGGVVFSPLWATAIDLFGFSVAVTAIGVVMVLDGLVACRSGFRKDTSADGYDPGRRRIRCARNIRHLGVREAASRRAAVGRFSVSDAGGRNGARPVRADRIDRASLLPAGARAGRAAGGARYRGGDRRRHRGPNRRRLVDAGRNRSAPGGLRELSGADRGLPYASARRRRQRTDAGSGGDPVRSGHRQCHVTSAPHRQVEFVKADEARVVALVVAIAQGAYAFAPAAFGLVREMAPQASDVPAGAAPFVFAVAALFQGLAIAAFLAGRRR
jgi:hypothetical protein